jgi:hypothetical protein
MSTYVDNSSNPYGRMKMCHMVADTSKELNAMATKIGVPLKWLQNTKYPHFDICQSKRALAVKFGAIEVSKYRLIEISKTIKEKNG